ncbi:MAG TPA: hypothetical protein VM100_14500 [Longimicrobiales bacterium]|nr:hypothetical protein [Longimicrobiales bacterium]
MQRHALLICTLAIIAACDQGDPTAALPNRQNAATVDRGTALFHQDFTDFIACAGESVRFVFDVPYTTQLVTTSNGTTYKMHFQSKGSTGTGTGLTTGNAWNLDNISLTYHETTNTGGITQYEGMGLWRSADGSIIQNHEQLKVHFDANGNPVRDEFSVRFDCRGSW